MLTLPGLPAAAAAAVAPSPLIDAAFCVVACAAVCAFVASFSISLEAECPTDT